MIILSNIKDYFRLYDLKINPNFKEGPSCIMGPA